MADASSNLSIDPDESAPNQQQREWFQHRLELAMEKIGIKNFHQLAKLADVSHSSIRNWVERGEIPRGSSRYTLAKALKVDPEWLRTGEGSMEPAPAPKHPLAWMEHVAPIHNGEIQMHEGIVNLLIAATQESTAFCLAAGLPLETDQMNKLVMAVVQRCYDEGTLVPLRQHVAEALTQMLRKP